MPDLVRCAPDDVRWGELLSAVPDSLPFHHPAWMSLIADCYRFDTFVGAVERTDGTFGAGIPVIEVRHPLSRRTRWVSLPFTDRCPILTRSSEDRAELLAALAEAADAAGVQRVEMRTEVTSPGVRSEGDALSHVLDVDAETAMLLSRVGSSHRRNIKAATRNGVTVRVGTAEEDLTETFYALQVETRHRQGTPVQPRRYFRMLWERVLAPGLGRLLLAEHDGTPVAGMVLLASPSTVIYKYGASSFDAWPLRPNDLLVWNAIEWAARSGRQRFDFGRTACTNEGLARFKRGWGAEETPLRYSVLGDGEVPGAGEVSGVLRSVIRRSPSSIARVTGELFYRYAA